MTVGISPDSVLCLLLYIKNDSNDTKTYCKLIVACCGGDGVTPLKVQLQLEAMEKHGL